MNELFTSVVCRPLQAQAPPRDDRTGGARSAGVYETILVFRKQGSNSHSLGVLIIDRPNFFPPVGRRNFIGGFAN